MAEKGAGFSATGALVLEAGPQPSGRDFPQALQQAASTALAKVHCGQSHPGCTPPPPPAPPGRRPSPSPGTAAAGLPFPALPRAPPAGRAPRKNSPPSPSSSDVRSMTTAACCTAVPGFRGLGRGPCGAAGLSSKPWALNPLAAPSGPAGAWSATGNPPRMGAPAERMTRISEDPSDFTAF